MRAAQIYIKTLRNGKITLSLGGGLGGVVFQLEG